MASIKCNYPYLDAVCLRVGSCEITMKQIWRILIMKIPSSSRRGDPISKHKRYWNKHELGYGSRLGPKSTTTVLARVSSNLLDLDGTKNGSAGMNQQQFTWLTDESVCESRESASRLRIGRQKNGVMGPPRPGTRMTVLDKTSSNLAEARWVSLR
jgi:hypothetical protein